MRLGRYETVREVAKGGMATVYLARALAEGGFERLVALKLMHPQYTDQPEFEAMFFDEARLAAKIRHPNVVGTIDVQKAPEGLFLVMDYVEGPTLGAILKELRASKRPPPIDVMLRITLDLLAGLHAAHELRAPDGASLGLVHRDVSPQNVLVGGDGITRITDFGVARANVRATSTEGGQIKGKLGYMPPEQLAGGAIDARADIYAGGVVLWEALTGHRLFTGEDTGVLIAGVLRGAGKTPKQARPDIPEGLDRACMKALRLDPDARYPSAAAFGEELEQEARRAGVVVASPRETGQFVRGLDAFRARVVPDELDRGSYSSASLSRGGAANGPSAATPSAAVLATADQSSSGRRRLVVSAAFVGALAALGAGAWLARTPGAGGREAASSAPPAATADASAASAPAGRAIPTSTATVADAGVAASAPLPASAGSQAPGGPQAGKTPSGPVSVGKGVRPPAPGTSPSPGPSPENFQPTGL